MNKQLAIKSFIAVLGAGVLIVGAVVPAYADPLSTATGVARAAEVGAQLAGASIVGARGTSATAYGFTNREAAIQMPETTTGVVKLGANPDSLSISLPREVGNVAGSLVSSDMVVYVGSSGASTTVKAGRGKLQQTIVISSASAPSRYSFTVDSRLSPSLQPNGSVYLTASLDALDPTGAFANGNQRVLAGIINPAWSVDANGTRVPTRYAVDGQTVTQVVDFTSSSIFPVVADPTALYFWWGQATKFSRSETNAVAAAANSGYPALVTAFCGLIASAPGAVGCGVVSGAFILFVGNQFKAAKAQGRCIQVNMPYVGIIIGGPLTWSVNIVKC